MRDAAVGRRFLSWRGVGEVGEMSGESLEFRMATRAGRMPAFRRESLEFRVATRAGRMPAFRHESLEFRMATRAGRMPAFRRESLDVERPYFHPGALQDGKAVGRLKGYVITAREIDEAVPRAAEAEAAFVQDPADVVDVPSASVQRYRRKADLIFAKLSAAMAPILVHHGHHNPDRGKLECYYAEIDVLCTKRRKMPVLPILRTFTGYTTLALKPHPLRRMVPTVLRSKYVSAYPHCLRCIFGRIENIFN